MPSGPVANLNMIGARGLDLRSAESDVKHMHALALVNVDLFPTPTGPARIQPRPWFRRYEALAQHDPADLWSKGDPTLVLEKEDLGTVDDGPTDYVLYLDANTGVAVYYRCMYYDGSAWFFTKSFMYWISNSENEGHFFGVKAHWETRNVAATLERLSENTATITLAGHGFTDGTVVDVYWGNGYFKQFGLRIRDAGEDSFTVSGIEEHDWPESTGTDFPASTALEVELVVYDLPATHRAHLYRLQADYTAEDPRGWSKYLAENAKTYVYQFVAALPGTVTDQGAHKITVPDHEYEVGDILNVTWDAGDDADLALEIEDVTGDVITFVTSDTIPVNTTEIETTLVYHAERLLEAALIGDNIETAAGENWPSSQAVFGTASATYTDHQNRITRMRFHRAVNGDYYLLFQAGISGGAGELTGARQYRVPFNTPPGEQIVYQGSSFMIRDMASLGDKIWATRDTANPRYLYYADGLTNFAAAKKPGQASISSLVSQEGSGLPEPAVAYSYVAQQFNTDTGIRGLPSPAKTIAPLGGDVDVFDYFYTDVGHEKVKVSYGGEGSDEDTMIWRTGDGGEFHQFVDEEAGSPYYDEVPDSSLSVQTLDYDVGACSGMKYIEAHKGILFAAHQVRESGGDVSVRTSYLRWSHSGKPYNFPDDPLESVGFEFDINPNDDDEITALASFGQTLVVFKRRRVFVVTGDPPDGFRWDSVPGSEGRGCVNHLTVQHTNAGLMWLSPLGICLMKTPGGTPTVVSEQVKEFFVETQREDELDPSVTFGRGRPTVRAEVTPGASIPLGCLMIVVDSGGSSYWIRSSVAATRQHCRKNGAKLTAQTFTVDPNETVQIEMEIPLSIPKIGGGDPLVPVADTEYTVRVGVYDNAQPISEEPAAWFYFQATWSFSAGRFRTRRMDAENSDLCFSIDYHVRQEYWLWIPTGGKSYCDVCMICDYSGLVSGQGSPVWRMYIIPASAAAVSDPMDLDNDGSGNQREYVVIGTPDGQLLCWPTFDVGHDYDITAGLGDKYRLIDGYIDIDGDIWDWDDRTALSASPILDDKGEDYLVGQLIVIRSAVDGQVYHGLITASNEGDHPDTPTGTVDHFEMEWLEGRHPPVGDADVAIGGVGCQVESSWLQLAQTSEGTAIIKAVNIHSGQASAEVQLEVRGMEEPDTATHGELGEVWSEAQKMAIGRGNRHSRMMPHVRGHRHQLRLTAIEHRTYWAINEIGVYLEPTGSNT